MRTPWKLSKLAIFILVLNNYTEVSRRLCECNMHNVQYVFNLKSVNTIVTKHNTSVQEQKCVRTMRENFVQQKSLKAREDVKLNQF